jgi:hypothetical protein
MKNCCAFCQRRRKGRNGTGVCKRKQWIMVNLAAFISNHHCPFFVARRKEEVLAEVLQGWWKPGDPRFE